MSIRFGMIEISIALVLLVSLFVAGLGGKSIYIQCFVTLFSKPTKKKRFCNTLYIGRFFLGSLRWTK